MNDSVRDNEKTVFGLLFQLSNALQTYLDKELKDDGITAKQFLLMIVLGTFGDAHPTFNELADRFGSSHQNVKQIGLKLQKSGYINIDKDKTDGRARRISFTEKAYSYWSDRDERDLLTFNSIFKDIDNDTLKTMATGLMKLHSNINEL